jgi:putative phosphoribosyl transferase
MPELAMGAIARGVRVLNDEVIQQVGITPAQVEEVAQSEAREVERRERVYRVAAPSQSWRTRL